MDMKEPLTPKQRVFGTLRIWYKKAKESPDLNKEREMLIMALEHCLSWETELVNKEDTPKRKKNKMTKFKEMRIRRKMTQDEIARRKGVSQGAISQIEREGIRLVKTANEYAEIFKCSPFELMDL